MPKGDTIR